MKEIFSNTIQENVFQTSRDIPLTSAIDFYRLPALLVNARFDLLTDHLW